MADKSYKIEKRGEEWTLLEVSGVLNAADTVIGTYKSEAEATEEKKKYDADMTRYEIKDVEIFSTGTYNGDKYSVKDLEDIVSSFGKTGYDPPIKLGHDEKPGVPAVGWVANLRRIGEKLVADFIDMPKEVYEAVKRRMYDRVSAEIYWNLNLGKNVFRRALKAVALLGGEIPAVTNLKPLQKSLVEIFAKATGLVKHVDYIVDTKNQENDMNNDNRVAELTAKINELTTELTTYVSKEKDSEKYNALQQQLETTTTSIAALQEQQKQEQIKMQAMTLKVPALRPYIQLFCELAYDSKKTIKFKQDDKTEIELSPSKMVDNLIATLNKKFAHLYREMGAAPYRDNRDADPDAGAETHKRTLKYITEHNLDKVRDYQTAMHAVLDADPELKAKYAA